ncbi:MAG: hypothetical protein RL748_4224 [Pseudomonadota bacterium]|jgi:hypothetical protein
MNIAKNMEAIFVTVALFGLTAAWVAPSDEHADVQISGNVVAQVAAPAPAPASHSGV